MKNSRFYSGQVHKGRD